MSDAVFSSLHCSQPALRRWPSVPAPLVVWALALGGLAAAGASVVAEHAPLRATPQAVEASGLIQQRYTLVFQPARLAGLGLSQAALEAALPVDAGHSAPGRLAILPQAGRHGPQPIADMRIGGHRLGDFAVVERQAMVPPVATQQGVRAP